MKDRVIVGGLAGMAGSLSSAVYVFILNLADIGSKKLFFLNASIFLTDEAAKTLAGNIYGFIIHLLVGAIIGMVFLYFFPATGDDYLFIKGMLLGGVSWLFIGGILGTMLGLEVKDTILEGYLMIIKNIIFGVVTIYISSFLYREEKIES